MIDFKDKSLEGSAIFFQGKSPVSWIVRIGGLLTPKHGYELSEFSHVETIFFNEAEDELYTIGALKPYVRIKPLREVLNERRNDYKVILKLNDFSYEKLQRNRKYFQITIRDFIGMKYSEFTAIMSELDPIDDGNIWNWLLNKYLKTKKEIHCSALDAAILQKSYIAPDKIPYLEFTPDDSYDLRADFSKTAFSV